MRDSGPTRPPSTITDAMRVLFDGSRPFGVLAYIWVALVGTTVVYALGLEDGLPHRLFWGIIVTTPLAILATVLLLRHDRLKQRERG